MTKVNVIHTDGFSGLINRVAESGERIVIEQQGEAIAAIVTYADLKRLETIDAILLEAELEEYEWLKAATRNPAFDVLKDPEEDIYTLSDGKPFQDSEWIKIVASESTSSSLIDSEDIYTLTDGKPFHNEG